MADSKADLMRDFIALAKGRAEIFGVEDVLVATNSGIMGNKRIDLFQF